VRDRAEEALVIGLKPVGHDLDEDATARCPLQMARSSLSSGGNCSGHADVERRHDNALEDVDRDGGGGAAQADDLRDGLEQAAGRRSAWRPAPLLGAAERRDDLVDDAGFFGPSRGEG